MLATSPCDALDRVQDDGDSVVQIQNGQGDHASFCAGVAIRRETDARPGLIATAAHCLHDGETPRVSTRGGQECAALTATVDREHDAAVLRVANCKLRPVQTSTRKLKQGEALWIVGHPLGQQWSVSRGVVSRIDEEGRIQTDAALNMGNSGGGCFDSGGMLVGIASSLRTPSWFGTWSGIGYCVPISSVLVLR